jgi:hypothetical protein
MLCDICRRKPPSGKFCYVADIWMDTREAECCWAFKREDHPVYNPPAYIEPEPQDPYP